MIGRNYPEVLSWNWEELQQFLEQTLAVDNHKLHIATLKMLEEWLTNFNKDYNKKDSLNMKGSESDEK